MNLCTKCESLVPLAHDTCPVCGARQPERARPLTSNAESTSHPSALPQSSRPARQSSRPVRRSSSPPKAVAKPVPAAAPIVDGGLSIEAVAALSSRVERFAKTGRSRHHHPLVATAAIAGMAAFGLGALAGWSDPPAADFGAPAEIGFYDLEQVVAEGHPVPDDLTSVLVTAVGQSCDASWSTDGFLIHDLVVIPGYHPSPTSGVRLLPGAVAGTIIGTNQDPLSMIISSQGSSDQGLSKGKISTLRPGTQLYQLSNPGSPVITSLTVESVRSYRNGALTLRFNDPSALVPGAPILDNERLIVAFVNPAGTNAITIDLLEPSLSNAKLSPSFAPVACPTEAIATDNTDDD